MKISSTLFIILSVAASVVAKFSTATSRVCEGAKPIRERSIGVLNVTTFECGDNESIQLHSRPQTRGSTPAPLTSGLESRQSSAFCDGVARCECSMACSQFCFAGSAPVQSDCQTIANVLTESNQVFVVQPNQFEFVTFQTCESVFVNAATIPLEFCLFDLGDSTSASYLDCTELLGGGQGGCIGADELWFTEYLPVGGTIFVP